MKKLAFFILVILFFLGVWVVKTWTGNSQSPVHVLESTSNVRQTYHIPKTLQISKLGINVPIESVAMDEKGRMDVPKDPDNVAWYNLGVKPGEQGNAVMAGHFDKETGEPAVFYDIEKLTRGDTISITDKNNQVITFSVVQIMHYPDHEFPLQEVFGASQKHRLNLITCDGKWNEKTQNYSHRTVVYAELVSDNKTSL